jgi:hypothetical protein
VHFIIVFCPKESTVKFQVITPNHILFEVDFLFEPATISAIAESLGLRDYEWTMHNLLRKEIKKIFTVPFTIGHVYPVRLEDEDVVVVKISQMTTPLIV